MPKDSFILYCSQVDALSELTDAQLGRLIRYLVQNLQKGSIPAKRESNALLTAFNFLKLQCNIDLGKYEKRKEQQRTWVQNKRKNKRVDNNDNDNGNKNGNVNDNENENDNVNKCIDSFSFVEKQEDVKRQKYLLSLKDWWNANVEKHNANVPKVQRMTIQRARAYQAIARQYTRDEIAQVVRRVCESDYMNGRTQEKRLATFDFVFQESNFLKILEGAYR